MAVTHMQQRSKQRRTRERMAFVLIDGLADIHIPEMADLTPLEAADTPAFDAIAAAGLNGLLDPVEPGLACGSDTAHLSILGYDPRLHYRGRGAFESMGAGINMTPGDIAFKCNFATLEEQTGVVLKRRADRHFESLGPVLCDALNGIQLPSFPELTVKAKYATEHRCGIAVSGPGLSDDISGTDPLKDNLPLQVSRPLQATAEAKRTAAVVNELSQEMQKVLRMHPVNVQRIEQGLAPANVVLLRGCGSRIAVPSFLEQHGMRACMVAPTKIIAGLGMSLGIHRLHAPGTTGDYRTEFHIKAEKIAQALIEDRYDFGFLHIKAVDDTGHDREPALKVQYLECIDVMVRQLVARLHIAEAEGLGLFTICITGDHSTPVLFGDHSHEPVPFTIAHVQHVVEQLGGAEAVSRTPLCHIPHPKPAEQQPPLRQLGSLARQRMHAELGMASEPGCKHRQHASVKSCAEQHAQQQQQQQPPEKARNHVPSRVERISNTGTQRQGPPATYFGKEHLLDTHSGSAAQLEHQKEHHAESSVQKERHSAQRTAQKEHHASALQHGPGQTALASRSGTHSQTDLPLPPGLQSDQGLVLQLDTHNQTDRPSQPSMQGQQHWLSSSSSAQAALPTAQASPSGTQSHGDAVLSFGEAAAARGFLGRFPGSEVMPLVQQFIGL